MASSSRVQRDDTRMYYAARVLLFPDWATLVFLAGFVATDSGVTAHDGARLPSPVTIPPGALLFSSVLP
jgi:hypothetical protein